MASSSQWKNDVFLSFRGGDTCNRFVNHLFDVLFRNRIVTFKDDKGGAEDCCVSVVVFSENYAFSPSCLDELVKIVDCQHKGQIVVPIFYKIEPTDVQQLTGRFGDAILQHKNEFSSSLVDAWIQALKAVSELTSFVLWNIRHETKLIEEIVDHILKILSHAVSSSSHDGLVGIDSRVNDIEALLAIESENVLCLGIWGMSGIGKSTIARKVFNQISSQFEGRSFVANVQEKLDKCSLDSLRREIICKLLGKRSSNLGMPTLLSHSTRQQIKRKKVLIVLDDVTDLAQMEYLVGQHSIYGAGSKIIITNKDKQLLINGGAKIYEVKKLHFREALHLFSLHAFKKCSPAEMHMKLATRAINYAQGIPLALKVLGSNLYNKSVSKWEDEFEKLGNISDQNVQKILRISYDELEEEEKDIFVDIACFFNSEDKDLIESILDSNGFLLESDSVVFLTSLSSLFQKTT